MKTKSIESYLQYAALSLFKYIDEKAQKKKFNLFALIIIVGVSLFFAFPSYDIAFSEEMSENWNAILRQIQNPLGQIELNDASHEANLAFRLTPILLANLFRVNTIGGLLTIQVIGFVFMLATVLKLFNKIINDPVAALLFSLALSMTFVGNVLCSDYRGFFDVIAFLFIAISLYFKNSLVVFISLLLAFFTDERALICSGLIGLYFLFDENRNTDKFTKVFTSRTIVLLISISVYLVSRYVLYYSYGLKTNTSGLITYLSNNTIHHVNIAPFALWSGLEGFWLVFALSILVLLIQKRIELSLMFFLCLLPTVLVALWVFDITRSMAYLFPVVFISPLILSGDISTVSLRYVALIVLLLCLFPTYYAGGPHEINWFYPLPLQMVRMIVM